MILRIASKEWLNKMKKVIGNRCSVISNRITQYRIPNTNTGN